MSAFSDEPVRLPDGASAPDQAWADAYVAWLVRPHLRPGKEKYATRTEERARSYLRDAWPYIEQLWSLGIKVGYFSDMRSDPFLRKPNNFAKAAPVILDALVSSPSALVREEAADAVFEFSKAGTRALLLEPVCAAYASEGEDRVRWVLAQSIRRLAGPKTFEMIRPLVGDPLTDCDGELLLALARTTDHRAEDSVLEYLVGLASNGPANASGYALRCAIESAGLLRSERAIAPLRQILSVAPEYASDARKTIKRIESR